MTQLSPKQPSPNHKNQYNESVESIITTDNPRSEDIISLEGQGDYIPPNNHQQKPSPRIKTWWERVSLKHRARIAAISLGVIPVLIVGGVAWFLSYKQAKDRIIETQITAVENANDQVELFVGDRIKDVIALSQVDLFSDSNLRTTIPREAKDSTLDTYGNTYPYYKKLVFMGINGEVLALSGEALEETERNFFEKVLRRSEPLISQPQYSQQDKSYYVYISAPIMDKNSGEIVGLIGASMSTQAFSELLVKYQLEEQKYFLVDGSNKITGSNIETSINQGLETILPRLSNQEEVSYAFDYLGGEQHIAAITPSKKLREYDLNWQTVLAQPTQAVLAGSNLGLPIILTTLIAAAIAALLAKMLADKITQPLIKAITAANRINQGDLETDISVRGADEISQLQNQMNEIRVNLHQIKREQELAEIQASELKNITQEISIAMSRKQLFETVTKKIRSSLQTDRVIIYRFDETWAGKVVAESVAPGWPKALGATIADPCFAEEYVERYRKGRVQATDDIYSAGLTECYLQQLEPFAVRANLVAPIIYQEKLLGLLIAHQCSDIRHWEKVEKDFFSQIAAQVGVALERVDLLQEQELSFKLAEQLKNLTLKLAGTFDTETIFDNVTTEIRNILKTDRVIIYRFDETWQGTIVAESVKSEWPRALGSTIADPCFAERYVEKYQQGRVKATDDIYNAGLTECHIKQLSPFAVRANIVAPILVKGKLTGLLISHQCSDTRHWEPGEIAFFGQVSTQVGLALERVELIEGQKIAEAEQRAAREQLQQRALELLMEVDPVSQGDLTIRASVTADEIGTIADSYNATIESLRRIVTQVLSASKQVAETTGTNETSVQMLSKEAMEQAHNISAALDKIKAMTESIKAVASNAEEAELAVKQANQSVELGDDAMNRTVDGIMTIRETVAETGKKVKRLGESTQRISKVVNLISSFAEQTNLLALNASIEAAHAGEEGRGFAVVAEEVRSLAQQSAKATAEIAATVAEIQAETNEVVSAMEAGTEQVVAGTKLVEETRTNLNQITAASAKISQLVTEITKTALEQAKTSENVSETMTEVAVTSNKTSLTATEVSDSFKQLLAVAKELQESVGQFKVQ